MATKPVLSARNATKTKVAVKGCEFKQAFTNVKVCTVQYMVNSRFSEILELKPVQEFHQE